MYSLWVCGARCISELALFSQNSRLRHHLLAGLLRTLQLARPILNAIEKYTCPFQFMGGKGSEARSSISGKKIKLKVKKTKEDMEVRSAFPSRNIGHCDSFMSGVGSGANGEAVYWGF